MTSKIISWSTIRIPEKERYLLWAIKILCYVLLLHHMSLYGFPWMNIAGKYQRYGNHNSCYRECAQQGQWHYDNLVIGHTEYMISFHLHTNITINWFGEDPNFILNKIHICIWIHTQIYAHLFTLKWYASYKRLFWVAVYHHLVDLIG